jgi:hypothetical protein
MITIPDQISKKWFKANNSDLFGNIFETKHLNFDEEGYLKLAYSSRSTFNEDSGNADWDRPAVIIYNGDVGNYFIETWDEPFSIDRQILAVSPSQITDANHPNGGYQSDADWFDGKLAVSESNDVHYYNSADNTWTDTNISLSTTFAGQHPIKNFLSKAALAVANINTVLLYSALSATPTLLATLTIPADFMITSMAYFNQNLYIGTRHQYGGEAAMYIWNGDGTAAQQVFVTSGSEIIHDVCPFNGSVALLASDGGLYRFNGSGFTLLDGFPIYYTEKVLTDDSNINLYHNILKAVGEKLYISFSDNDNNSSFELNQPCGVWCYDARVGFLYHKFSFSNAMTYKLSDPTIDTTNDYIAVTQDIPTGTEIWYHASTPNTNLAALVGTNVDDIKLYAVRVDATHIRLASSLANAVAGTYINFTADDGIGEDWVIFPNIDFGQMKCDRPAPICPIIYSQSSPWLGTEIIWSSDLSKRDLNSSAYIGSVSTGVEARGWFSTPKIFSSEILDRYNLLTLKFVPLVNETDKIIIKYRLIDDNRNQLDLSNTGSGGFWSIAWTSKTTFTTSRPEWASARVGDEVTIIEGAAGGMLAHITSIPAPVGGVYTVTIDENYECYQSGDVSIAVFRNWKKFQVITYGDKNAVKGFFKKQLGKAGKFLQIKVELRGINVKIEELKINNKSLLPSVNS